VLEVLAECLVDASSGALHSQLNVRENMLRIFRVDPKLFFRTRCRYFELFTKNLVIGLFASKTGCFPLRIGEWFTGWSKENFKGYKLVY